MTHPVKGVDHLFLLVNDLDESAEKYRKLGFTLSPRGLHSKEKGTGNYTIMFPHDYIELLGVVEPTDRNEHQRDKLQHQGEGLHAVACRIDNAENAKQSLAELGIATGPVGAFARPVELPNGGEGIAAFEAVSFADEEVPQGMVFMCQHKSRDMVWRPELLDHKNGAIGLAAIVGVSNDPENTARKFSCLYADGAVDIRDGIAHVLTGENSADLVFMSEEHAKQYFPGMDIKQTPISAFSALRIKAKNLDTVAQILSENGVAFSETPSGLAIAPVHASGTILEFCV